MTKERTMGAPVDPDPVTWLTLALTTAATISQVLQYIRSRPPHAVPAEEEVSVRERGETNLREVRAELGYVRHAFDSLAEIARGAGLAEHYGLRLGRQQFYDRATYDSYRRHLEALWDHGRELNHRIAALLEDRAALPVDEPTRREIAERCRSVLIDLNRILKDDQLSLADVADLLAGSFEQLDQDLALWLEHLEPSP